MKRTCYLAVFLIALISVLNAQPFGRGNIERDSLRLMEELGIDGSIPTLSSESFMPEVNGRDSRQTGQYLFTSGCPNEVVHEGPFAYVANTSSIEVLDVSDPENPQHLLSYSAADVIGIDVQGGNIFVTSTSTGLSIYQYDPDENELDSISTFHHSPNIQYRYVDVAGTHAFISCAYGLEVVDITDITSPAHDVFISCGKLNKDLVAKDYRVFMSGAFYGVYIFDFEDHFATGGAVKWDLFEYDPEHGAVNCVDLDVNGDFLYVADYYNGLQVFDWRESEWLGECYSWLRCNTSGVAVSGDWVYLTTTSDYAGILYAIDVHEHDSSMTPYAIYYYSYGAVSPDPCSHIMLMVSGRAYPYAEFMAERIAYTPAEVTPQWVGHTEITPYGPYMFGGWVVVEGDDIYVCGLGYTLSKYHLTRIGGIHSYELVCQTDTIDEGYSAAIYGDHIFVAGKRGLWKFDKTDLSLEDIDETVQIYGEVALYGNYAFVFGFDTPCPSPVGIRNVIAAYDISTPSIIFLDKKYYGSADIAYQDNWYYFGLLSDNVFHFSSTGSDIYLPGFISTRAKECWTQSSNPFIPHSGYGNISTFFDLSVELFETVTGVYFLNKWCSADGFTWGSGAIITELYDINWDSDETSDFLARWRGWAPGDLYYSNYATYSMSPDYNGIRTHKMEGNWPSYYWAVWDEEGITNSNRFPLWYCKSLIYGAATDFTRIYAPTPLDPDWIVGLSFDQLIPIHFAKNGSDELILITKKSGSLNYFIDVLQVEHHLCGGGYAKRKADKKVSQPDKLTINVTPNPFNASCNICFNLPEKAEINFEVYSTSGRKVYERKLGELESGKHSQVWNGIDKNGISVASGLYLVRIKTASTSITQKALFLK